MTRLSDALAYFADAIESRRVDIGPLTISSREAYGRLIRSAFELGRDAGPESAVVAPVRHLRVVHEKQG